ncbi:MAG: putative beta-lysine N-acetyltransferase [Desulfitobacteriaceae bacterium]|nr:putative beta-lysine N-acetyltransferase [Desulfitobacteriaceae bacterium]MDD4346567.1 putative beta-lysine N-acetyltransferase [Desulfitobacteriaceae bacterium]MDD4401098.1 putative beta-lysine N-acetyltransferase [Desulfitobacteriaceae bacterium]
MNISPDNHRKNFFTTFKSVELYIDYTNQRLKILNFLVISTITIKEIIAYAGRKKLGKIIYNCPEHLLRSFQDCGFVIEGIIDGYFRGEDAACISFFLNKERSKSIYENEENRVIDFCREDTKKFTSAKNRTYKVRSAEAKDIPQMIQLFSAVFETYPSPVFSRDYLQKVMREQVLFMIAEEEGKIISIAAADMNKLHMNAEITDCATYPEYRGRSILSELIYGLEEELKHANFTTAYSLSRANSIGINKSLSKLGYLYSGRLINNCHICGGYEDMNIWVKIL